MRLVAAGEELEMGRFYLEPLERWSTLHILQAC